MPPKVDDMTKRSKKTALKKAAPKKAAPKRPKRAAPKRPERAAPKRAAPKRAAPAPNKIPPKKIAAKKPRPKKIVPAQAKDLSSPESTGHAGAFFEQHVDAAFLALLLVRGIAPFLMRAEVVEVHLQTSHHGWATDDLLAIGLDEQGLRRSLAASVKRTFTMAKSDPECVDVFTKAWTDFRSTRFVYGRDAIALITRPSSAQMTRGLRVLLETARASLDGADLRRRLELPKYRDKLATEYADTIREIVEQTYKGDATDDRMHTFLCAFDFVCLDLNTPGSAVEALLHSLLRVAVVTGAPPDVATTTWNSLLNLVSGASPIARSFRRDSLSPEIREKFSSSNAHVTQLLVPFEEMTRTVSNGVDLTIAGHHEPRIELEQQTVERLNRGQVVVLGGLAGSGKSAVAKAVFEAIGKGAFAVAMRAEMLAKATLGETLVAMGASITRLRQVVAMHPAKVLWIDGAERLLEKPAAEREAFNDMMRLVREDPTWKVVITCRAYSLETFRAAFLDESRIESSVILVPTLGSTQLDAFAAHCPKLSRPLGDPSLRSLLSNPFFLKMAARLEWDAATPLPANERAFRAEVWKQVIRRDSEANDGMPLRRASTYVAIALRRAQSFDAFVDVDGFDAAAVIRLNADTLLLESSELLGRYAPAHDVLEDWALLQWLDTEYERAHRAWPAFLEVLGVHPAIRRTFRSWLAERIEIDPVALHATAALINDENLPRHWTDDALVAVLRSNDPGSFLEAHESALLAVDAHLLRRAIHLVRVACQQPLTDTPEEIAAGAQRPTGMAWQRVAEFVARHLDVVVPLHAPLLIQFVQDWSASVTHDDPYPDGSTSIGSIVRRLLDGMDVHAYSRNEDVSRVLKVLLKIPKTSEQRIRAIADECVKERFREEEPFVELVLSSLYGAQLCRDLPDITIRIVARMLAPPEPKDPDRYPFGHRETLAERFGLDDGLDHYGNPASALNGPYRHLLHLHTGDGLALIIETINRCSARYLEHEGEDLEWKFELPDGRVVVHRGDGRLWSMYRVNSGPEVLRSILMALEEWLLTLGALGRHEFLRKVIVHIMSEATSLALSAVVASVVMAFPEQLGDVGLMFLRMRDLFDYDRSRAISDLTPTDKIFADAFPATSVEAWLFNDERVKSARRPHRRSSFEALALQLQTGQWREGVWKVLRDHAAQLPDEAEQSDEDRLWRLALHRMDLRNIEIQVEPDGRSSVRLASPPEDVKAVVERERPAIEASQRSMSAFLWAESCFSRSGDSASAGTRWRAELEYARTAAPHPIADARLYVALVCLRDHAAELSDDEFGWCVETVVSPFLYLQDESLRLSPIGGCREAATQLGAVLLMARTQEQRDMVQGAMFLGLLSGQHEISRSVAAGLGRDVWAADRTLALSFATALNVYTHREFALAMSQRRMSPADDRDAEAAQQARAELLKEIAAGVEANQVDIQALLRNDYTKSPARFIVWELAEMFVFQPSDPDARAFVERVSEQLRETWRAESRNRRRYNDREGFDHQVEAFIIDLLAAFALRSDEANAGTLLLPFRDLGSEYPEQVAELLRRIGMREHDLDRPQVFWSAWRLLSRPLVDWVNSDPKAWDSTVGKIAQAVFLDLYWKETTKSWRSLSGYESNVTDAFRALRPCEEGTDAFATFLATIGSGLMPEVLPLLAEKLSQPGSVLSPRTLGRFETMLAGLIYAGSARIRQEPLLRDATLRVLDILIDAGSSKAYRMRDDFVTPLR